MWIITLPFFHIKLKGRISMFDVNVIQTGSHGNAVMLDNCILIDFGLTYKHIGKYMEQADVIIATHRHGDHFKFQSLMQLFKRRPYKLNNGFYCNRDVALRVDDNQGLDVKFKVNENNILTQNGTYQLRTKKGYYTLETFPLSHGDVENQGLVITNESGDKLLYATDTSDISQAPNLTYDYIMLEGNYDYELWLDSYISFDKRLSQRAKSNIPHLPIHDFENFVHTHCHENTKVWQLHVSRLFGRVSTEVDIENADEIHQDLYLHQSDERKKLNIQQKDH